MLVLRGSDGSEAFLPGGVPDLQLDLLPLDINGADLEVHTNSRNVSAWSRISTLHTHYSIINDCTQFLIT